MLRSFLPVGQGAFYIEQFNEYGGNKVNVVYDCGSLTSKKIVQEEIKSNFYEGEEILLVFISHLDADHINGLEFLMKYCNVKNIVFPLIPKPERYLLSLKYLCESDENDLEDFSFRVISNPYDAVMREYDNTRIIEIRDRDNEVYNDEIMDNVTTLSSGVNILDVISPSKNSVLNTYWEYIPFNFRFHNRSCQFVKALKRNLKDIENLQNKIDIENIAEMWGYKSIQSAVKKAYREVNGDLNSNSMTLFSGVRESQIRQTYVMPFKMFRYHLKYSCTEKCLYDISKPNGCLYTGDYDTNSNWKELNKAYEKYWSYIGCIQVPHHGSYKNYNDKIAMYDAFYVISAGQNNQYRHPSGLVVKDLIYNKKYPFIVTEQRDKEVIFEVPLKKSYDKCNF